MRCEDWTSEPSKVFCNHHTVVPTKKGIQPVSSECRLLNSAFGLSLRPFFQFHLCQYWLESELGCFSREVSCWALRCVTLIKTPYCMGVHRHFIPVLSYQLLPAYDIVRTGHSLIPPNFRLRRLPIVYNAVPSPRPPPSAPRPSFYLRPSLLLACDIPRARLPEETSLQRSRLRLHCRSYPGERIPPHRETAPQRGAKACSARISDPIHSPVLRSNHTGK